jgi:hypothetical protein
MYYTRPGSDLPVIGGGPANSSVQYGLLYSYGENVC